MWKNEQKQTTHSPTRIRKDIHCSDDLFRSGGSGNNTDNITIASDVLCNWVKAVDGGEDLLLVTQSGILIRTAVENIRTAGRATQGVIVMRFKEEGDKVIAMALTDRDEAEETETGTEN